jgi:glucokinase
MIRSGAPRPGHRLAGVTPVAPELREDRKMTAEMVVAVDVGGTGIKAGLVTRDGAVQHRRREPTGADRGPEAVVATILRVAEELAGVAEVDAAAVGLVVPGVVDEAAGVAVWAANLGFHDVPLADRLADRLGLPAVVGHDVRAGGVAEARVGAGQGARHVLFAAIGTGIAAAQVIGGEAVAGAHGAAGELGHVTIRPGGPACACGGRGCLEAVASAAAIGRRYAELAGGQADAARVVAGVAAGDELAARVWREAIGALADGLVVGQALVDAEVIVIGGGLATAGDALLAPLRTAVKERLTFHRKPRLVPAALGDEAGCIGAGLRAWDRLAASR